MGIWGLPLYSPVEIREEHLVQKKGAATSRAATGSGDASPPESRPDNTWGWACNHCGRENHLLKGRSCQEVKTAQALPVAATHWRCPRCGEENRTARPACHGCFKPRTGKVELLRTAPSDDSRQSAHETSTSATSSRTTPATSSTGPTSSTAPGAPPTASSPAGGAGVCHQTPEAASAHVVVTGSGSLLVNTAGMLTRKTRRLVLPDALLEELGRIHSALARDFGVMPMQAFLQRVQAFLAELKARPHLLPEAAALMEREGAPSRLGSRS